MANRDGLNGVAEMQEEEEDHSGETTRTRGAPAFRAVEDLSKVLTLDDPDRMKLTQQEHRQAMEIKAMVEMSPDLDDLCDLMYVQLAIICRDNVTDAAQRCYAMQHFREEYKILDTPQEGRRYVEWLVRLHPKHICSFGFSETVGTNVFVHDPDKFDPKDLTSTAEEFLKAMYYCFIAFFPRYRVHPKRHRLCRRMRGNEQDRYEEGRSETFHSILYAISTILSLSRSMPLFPYGSNG